MPAVSSAPVLTASQIAPVQPAHRTRQATRKTMNQYTQLFTAEPSVKGAFDEAAADLTAFLDLSSYTTVGDSIVVPEAGAAAFDNAFGVPGAPMGALRPVDDSLLDSPLDLELSPATSFASSVTGSPFDLAVSSADFMSPLLSSFEESFSVPSSVTGEFPSLFAPVPGSDFLSASSFTMATEPQWVPQDLQLPVQPPAVDLVLGTASPMEDVKPIILAPSPALTRTESALFEAFAVGEPAAPVVPAVEPQQPQTQQVASVPNAAGGDVVTPSAPEKRKTVAELRKEAAQAMPEQSFKKDKFTGVRNTKKPMIDLDAPTLPKNYLTESATSKKRAGSAKYAASIVNKRARSTSSMTPGPELPQTQLDPIDADGLDESQLTAIEMKRRSNCLAARKSRARKAAHISELQDEVARLQSLNEALQAELAAARAGCVCQKTE